MKILIVEDDFASRTILQHFLAVYGECHVAANGNEAIQAFRQAVRQGERYDLICLDIMMPELDGQGVLKAIRKMEANSGIYGHDAAKIIMVSALDDPKNILEAFNSQCEAYLVKPVDFNKLRAELIALGLIGPETAAG